MPIRHDVAVERRRPVEIRYSVSLDGEWTPDVVGVHINSLAEDRSVALRRDGVGNWMVGDEVLEALTGATDIDFAWTPATNTIPIRRLDLESGESAKIDTIYVPFPDREVVRRSQTYERLAAHRWRCRPGDFEVDMTTDEDGFVVACPGLGRLCGRTGARCRPKSRQPPVHVASGP